MFSDRFRAVKVNSMRNCRRREEEAETYSDARRASLEEQKAKQLQFLSAIAEPPMCHRRETIEQGVSQMRSLLFICTNSIPRSLSRFVSKETLLRYTVFGRIPR
ncbi:hypothetical protein ZHAS_00015557 [Anopheles sinensis]|uniref:Uncharacterized protein n=1 Tax=Anopheles sinensis TaxID=74873 RepID=A0A084WBJ5_ANOSI|nr:hypothetical protein ZHAS_00015557 [Anopheles sinensis]